MKKLMKFADTRAGMITAIAVVGAVALYVAEKKAREAIGAAGNAVNPLNNDNVFASGVDSIGAKLSGNKNFKLGGLIYDVFNPPKT